MANKKVKVGELIFQIVIFLVALCILVFAFIPIFLMIVLSLKSQVQIYGNFWSLPNPVEWSNYSMAFTSLFPNMINSLIVVVVGVAGAVLLAANSGYVFAKLNFPGKNVLFMFIMALMMIPGCLTLTPQFTLIQDLGLKNSWFALWLPWVAAVRCLASFCAVLLCPLSLPRFLNRRGLTGAGSCGLCLPLPFPCPSPFWPLWLSTT